MGRTSSGLGIVAAVAVLGWSSIASAGEPVPNRHDGFYLQLQAGLGYLSSTAKADMGPLGEVKMTYKGLSLDTALLMGGSPIPGLAIGGALMTDYVPSPKVSQEGNSASLDDVKLYLVGIGPFVDFYPDPTKGLHFQAMVGWGGLEASYQGNAGGSDPTGLVMNVGGGYDFWVGDETSLGVMGRLGYAPLKLEETKYSTLSPAILATVTFN
jgi:hypothetical protein